MSLIQLGVVCVQYGLLHMFYFAKTAQHCGLNCINSAVELIMTRHCYGSEAGFTGGSLFCAVYIVLRTSIKNTDDG